MRIISGTKKGKKLCTPDETGRIRPTSDRARESLFNILCAGLKNPLAEYSVLDVFSGTGAIGLEAASRGAKSVTFIDQDLTLTKKNAALCGFTNLSFLKRNAAALPPAPHPFDLIFLDAPYNQGLTEKALASLINQNWCHKNTLLIAETARDEVLLLPNTLVLDKERICGAARFSFIKPQQSTTP